MENLFYKPIISTKNLGLQLQVLEHIFLQTVI